MNLFKFYSLFILFFLFNGKNANACDCSIPNVLDHIRESDFIAVAKINSLSLDTENSNRHNAEIEILKLYKGKPIKEIKVWSLLNSSCSFLPDEGSLWLIFSTKNYEGILGFGFCSGAILLDEEFDKKKKTINTKDFYDKTGFRLQVLDFLPKSKLKRENKAGLYISTSDEYLSGYRGSEIEGDRFALYELSIDTNLSIEAIEPIKEFTFSSSQRSLIPLLKENLKVYTYDSEKTFIKPQKLIIGVYFYPAEGKNESFLSLFGI